MKESYAWKLRPLRAARAAAGHSLTRSLTYIYDIFYCTQQPHAEVTKLLCPHHEGAGSPHPVRVRGPDLWHQMALVVDTTVEQSLVSSAQGGVRVCGVRMGHHMR